MGVVLPVSVLVATRNRSHSLKRMFSSLSEQSVQPVELIVVDGSIGHETQELCQSEIPNVVTKIKYQRARNVGAAIQRNEGMSSVTQEFLLLLDDDILFQEECLKRLWGAITSEPGIGGVNAMITNQCYHPPGLISRLLFRLLHGQVESSYAGKCIGPALNLLPEDCDDLPEIVPVEWLNTTCTLYRCAALPKPLFPSVFTGYSMMEDVTLSLAVGKNWKLANARTARIFHDSQPGEHKRNKTELAKMELINRHYVMTRILERQRFTDYLKLAILQVFGIVSGLTSAQGWCSLPAILLGKLQAIVEIVFAGVISNANS